MGAMQRQLKALDADIKQITEAALIRTQEIVTEQAEEAMADKYLPAKGVYSGGDTLKSLYRDKKVYWSGDTASIDAGFSIRKGGLASIFLIYGTPRMKKDQKLYNAFFSKKTKELIQAEQEKIFYNALEKVRQDRG
jgi:hypothetical protein